jgi:Transglutaminase-like superfamily
MTSVRARTTRAKGAEPPHPRPLSPREKAGLALEIAGTLIRVRRELRRSDLRQALARLRGSPDPAPAEPDPQSVAEWLRLGRVVRRRLRLLPGDTRCLTQSLVLLRLLSRRHVGGTLVIGVRPGVRFGAHAWVEVGERPLLPTGGADFERLVAL